MSEQHSIVPKWHTLDEIIDRLAPLQCHTCGHTSWNPVVIDSCRRHIYCMHCVKDSTCRHSDDNSTAIPITITNSILWDILFGSIKVYCPFLHHCSDSGFICEWMGTVNEAMLHHTDSCLLARKNNINNIKPISQVKLEESTPESKALPLIKTHETVLFVTTMKDTFYECVLKWIGCNFNTRTEEELNLHYQCRVACTQHYELMINQCTDDAEKRLDLLNTTHGIYNDAFYENIFVQIKDNQRCNSMDDIFCPFKIELCDSLNLYCFHYMITAQYGDYSFFLLYQIYQNIKNHYPDVLHAYLMRVMQILMVLYAEFNSEVVTPVATMAPIILPKTMLSLKSLPETVPKTKPQPLKDVENVTFMHGFMIRMSILIRMHLSKHECFHLAKAILTACATKPHILLFRVAIRLIDVQVEMDMASMMTDSHQAIIHTLTSSDTELQKAMHKLTMQLRSMCAHPLAFFKHDAKTLMIRPDTKCIPLPLDKVNCSMQNGLYYLVPPGFATSTHSFYNNIGYLNGDLFQNLFSVILLPFLGDCNGRLGVITGDIREAAKNTLMMLLENVSESHLDRLQRDKPRGRQHSKKRELKEEIKGKDRRIDLNAWQRVSNTFGVTNDALGVYMKSVQPKDDGQNFSKRNIFIGAYTLAAFLASIPIGTFYVELKNYLSAMKAQVLSLKNKLAHNAWCATINCAFMLLLTRLLEWTDTPQAFLRPLVTRDPKLGHLVFNYSEHIGCGAPLGYRATENEWKIDKTNHELHHLPWESVSLLALFINDPHKLETQWHMVLRKAYSTVAPETSVYILQWLLAHSKPFIYEPSLMVKFHRDALFQLYERTRNLFYALTMVDGQYYKMDGGPFGCPHTEAESKLAAAGTKSVLHLGIITGAIHCGIIIRPNLCDSSNGDIYCRLVAITECLINLKSKEAWFNKL